MPPEIGPGCTALTLVLVPAGDDLSARERTPRHGALDLQLGFLTEGHGIRVGVLCGQQAHDVAL
ncbi:hypothetical protein [Streptomyces avidinii]